MRISINPNFWLVAYEPYIINLLKSEIYLNSQNSLKNAMTLKKQLLDGELWDDTITSDVINKVVKNQGNQVKKEAFKQVKIFDFE
jgi:hypothetical protein